MSTEMLRKIVNAITKDRMQSVREIELIAADTQKTGELGFEVLRSQAEITFNQMNDLEVTQEQLDRHQLLTEKMLGVEEILKTKRN